MIQEDAAGGDLKQLYDQLQEPWGGVDNILKIHSLNPPSLRAHFEFYKTLMRGQSGLGRLQREIKPLARTLQRKGVEDCRGALAGVLQ